MAVYVCVRTCVFVPSDFCTADTTQQVCVGAVQFELKLTHTVKQEIVVNGNASYVVQCDVVFSKLVFVLVM